MAAIKKLTHDQILEREKALHTTEQDEGRMPYAAILEDRRQRWAAYIDAMPAQGWLTEWVAAMTVKYGPTVKVRRVARCGWVLALLLVRYGEAEYHWPDDGMFTEDDERRAAGWLRGSYWPPDVAPERAE